MWNRQMYIPHIYDAQFGCNLVVAMLSLYQHATISPSPPRCVLINNSVNMRARAQIIAFLLYIHILFRIEFLNKLKCVHPVHILVYILFKFVVGKMIKKFVGIHVFALARAPGS